MRALECATGEVAGGDVERAYYRRRRDVHDVVGSGTRFKIFVAEVIQVYQMRLKIQQTGSGYAAVAQIVRFVFRFRDFGVIVRAPFRVCAFIR